jgi:hypothetical protein
MITPYDVFFGAVLSLIGSAVAATVCTAICDNFFRVCSTSQLPGVLSDLQILFVFTIGPAFGLAWWWLVFVFLPPYLSHGNFWGN